MGLRLSTMLVRDGGKVYELSCAAKLTETVSPICGHVLRSLVVEGD